MARQSVVNYFVSGGILLLLLSACGGSGGGGGTPPSEPVRPQTIVYQQDAGGQDDLYAINEDGTGHVALSRDPVKFDVFEGMAPGNVVILTRREQAGGNQFNRDIYAVNLNGKNLIPLANSVDEDIFYAVTASGRVVYRSAGKLYSIKADGSDRIELVDSLGAGLEFHTVTPDNKVIYRLSSDTYIRPADGTEIPDILSSNPNDEFISVAPDGRIILRGNNLLYSIRSDGTDRRDLSPQAGINYWVVNYSSNGRVIYINYVNNNQYNLYSVNTDGTGHVTLAGSANSESYETITDNDYVIYLMTNNLYAIKADGSGSTTKLTNYDINLYISFVHATSTNKIIYTRDPAPGNQMYDIYSVSLDGSNNGPVVSDPDAFLFMNGFTDNGRMLYQRSAGKGPTIGDLYSIDINGNNRVTLAADPDLGESFWYATGNNRIIYLANDGVDSEIYSVDADGRNRKALTHSGGNKKRVYLK